MKTGAVPRELLRSWITPPRSKVTLVLLIAEDCYTYTWFVVCSLCIVYQYNND